MKNVRNILIGAALASTMALAAYAGGVYTPGFPNAASLNGSEQVPLDTEYPSGITPQTAYVTTQQLGAYAGQVSGAYHANAIIGGDFGTNLWQRGTTGTATTTVLTYGPDRWWALSGTGTEVKIIKETAAADTLNGFSASARVQRTAAQTGVIASCVGQVLTTANSWKFRNHRAEFFFWALAGANFSAASNKITATIGYSVSGAADQTAANFSTAAWTGQVNTGQDLNITTTWTKYSVVVDVPTTASQLGVEICFTPVGTAGANDWFEFTGAQLDINPSAVALTGLTNATGQGGNANAFAYRSPLEETLLQYSFFYRLNEPASGAALPGTCQAVGANTNICNVFMPVVMRATVPTITITTAGTFKVNIAGTPTTIATPTASTCGSYACAVTAANTNTAGQAELLTGGGGSGAWDISAEL